MMPAVPLMRAALVAAGLVAASPWFLSASARQIPDDELLCRFESNVEAYVLLHRRLEASAPPQVYTADPVALLRSRTAMALAIRNERPFARQGDIFAPSIAAMFRRIVARTLDEDGVDWQEFLVEDGMTLPIDVAVNADYPAGGPVATMRPTLLKALPPLPPELQYRFVNLTLVLWDVHANVIVDFVPDIFLRTTGPIAAR